MLKYNKYQPDIIGSYILAVFLSLFSSVSCALESDVPLWYEKDINGQPIIHLYFYWSEKCPHCQNALPDILEMDRSYPWLSLHSFELSSSPENVQKYIAMTSRFGNEAVSVPAFVFCGNLIKGYESKQTTGKLLKNDLLGCYQFAEENSPDNTTIFVPEHKLSDSMDIPLLGTIDSNEYSLPILTLLIAGMDAFNPCAFFVLLFLMSMMVHTRSRTRMALIGSIFIFFSGAMYFLFMAAWLNLFIYLGELYLMTIVAGCIAVFIALFNIKDYFWFKKGISLSISEQKKPRLFNRIRDLLKLDSIFTISVATIVLAVVANSYELLCTAGFPMVYTRALTLNSLSSEQYYLYLLLYNLIYVLPLIIIVSLFTIKLGSRKLTEHEGMVLKLLSGNMMLLLGMLLIVAPQLLNNMLTAIMILLLAIGITWFIVRQKQGNEKNKKNYSA